MKRLSQKNAFITGAGSWIGKEIAKTFARAGAKVFIISRDSKKLAATAGEIQALGGVIAYAQADVIDADAVQKAVAQAEAQFGGIDILVQNAGVYPSVSLDKMSLEEWRDVININLTGSFIVLQAVSPFLKKSTAGRVVFISSIAGEEVGLAGYAHYTASKAGMNGLMRTAAVELAPYKITVNSIDPGNIFNADVFTVTDAEMKSMLEKIPVGRFGTPQDIADLALFLASHESSFITGQHIVVDGGETIAC